MRRLAAYVHVNDDEGEHFVFGPDDVVPDWAAAKITNPKAWAADSVPAPDVSASEPTFPSTPAAAPDGPPPMHGAGSGGDAWAAYAAAQGLDIAEGASRGDIIEALEQAGVPVTKQQ